jgi:hypothetical protein
MTFEGIVDIYFKKSQHINTAFLHFNTVRIFVFINNQQKH